MKNLLCKCQDLGQINTLRVQATRISFASMHGSFFSISDSLEKKRISGGENGLSGEWKHEGGGKAS